MAKTEHRLGTDFGVDVGPRDSDSDGLNDRDDNCPNVANPDQADLMRMDRAMHVTPMTTVMGCSMRRTVVRG